VLVDWLQVKFAALDSVSPVLNLGPTYFGAFQQAHLLTASLELPS
jgi:hypothetical protein